MKPRFNWKDFDHQEDEELSCTCFNPFGNKKEYSIQLVGHKSKNIHELNIKIFKLQSSVFVEKYC